MASSVTTTSLVSTVSENQTRLLNRIATIRSSAKLCDVHFMVGKTSAKKRIAANSTLLALRSEVFESRFFGEGRNAKSHQVSANGKVLEVDVEDVDPVIFQEMLDYIVACPLNNNKMESNPESANPKVFFKSIRHAWELRSVAKKFGVFDLIQDCENYLYGRLTFRNALDYLVQAKNYSSEEFRNKVFKVMKNRGMAVLSTAKASVVCQLTVTDVVEIVKLYSYLETDYLIRFLELWGTEMETSEFIKMFRTHFYPMLRWDMISKESMQMVHDSQLLGAVDENRALLKLLFSKIVVETPAPFKSTIQFEASMSRGQKSNFLLKSIWLKIVLQGSKSPSYRKKEKVFASVLEDGTRLELEKVNSKERGFDLRKEFFIGDNEDVKICVKGRDLTGWVNANVNHVKAFKSTKVKGEFMIQVGFEPIPLSMKKSTKISPVDLVVELSPLILVDLDENVLLPKDSPRDQKVGVPEKKMKVTVFNWSAKWGKDGEIDLFDKKSHICEMRSPYISVVEFK